MDGEGREGMAKLRVKERERVDGERSEEERERRNDKKGAGRGGVRNFARKGRDGRKGKETLLLHTLAKSWIRHCQ